MEKSCNTLVHPNEDKCIYKTQDIGCKERHNCNGVQKKGCLLSKISNVK